MWSIVGKSIHTHAYQKMQAELSAQAEGPPGSTTVLSTTLADEYVDFWPGRSVSTIDAEDTSYMAPEKRELVQYLFAEITSMLEDAHELAAKGQAQNKSAVRLRIIAKDLATAANGVLLLAGSIDIVLGPQKPPRAKQHKGP